MNRYLCIHGHFYQPPRENPWLETVEVQDSAAPYHDWNQRVLAECYAMNALSRILDERGFIRRIVNNYSNISFDFGPTLLSWLEENAAEVYQAILDADRESRDRFSGHGSAMAQAYNHEIMPLGNRREKVTQIRWGLADFEKRFGRKAEGMWLPETAVDGETLDLLAEHGIRFVLLAPYQALRIRQTDRAEWEDTRGGKIDITRTYEADLPSGRTIAVFFYHGPLAQAVSFEGLLSSGDVFAQRLMDAYNPANPAPQLVHVATDGETYGHHHRFGDMALAYALDKVQSGGQAVLTNYGEFLEKNPPRWKVEIASNTSWSCAHGVERWRSNCSCNTGAHPKWQQAWRAPLRESLEALRDDLAPLYERGCAGLLRDAWEARDRYIGVVLDRSDESLDRFFREQALRELTSEERTQALKLLEMQRHAMLMFTSCGWFFDDLAGIETVQNLQYAARAVQLAQELFGDGIEERFLGILEKGRSNEKGMPDGKTIYEQTARSARVDLPQVAAHYAVSSLFEDYAEHASIHCYRVEREAQQSLQAGKEKLSLGRLSILSTITLESVRLCYGALHFGDQNFLAGVRPLKREEDCKAQERELFSSFKRGNTPEVIRLFDRYFGGTTYSLKDLFRDEQRKILSLIIEENLADAEAVYSQLYDDHAPLMRFLRGLKTPLPRAFQDAAAFSINSRLRRAMASTAPDVIRAKELLAEAQDAEIGLESETLAFALKGSVERLADAWNDRPEDADSLRSLTETVRLALSLPFWVDLWKAQNVYYGVLRNILPGIQARSGDKEKFGSDWEKTFLDLGLLLKVRTNVDEHSGG